MKVLFISAGDYKYGAPKAMFELFVTLKKEYSVEPVLLTKKRNELNHKCDLLGIENYAFWSRDIMAGSAYQNPIFNMMKHCVKYLLYLWGGITQKRVERIGIDFASIDIIHTNLNRNDIGVWISQKYKIPHVWHLRETLIGSAVAMYKPNVIDYMNKNITSNGEKIGLPSEIYNLKPAKQSDFIYSYKMKEVFKEIPFGIEHTLKVLKNAEDIMKGENIGEEEKELISIIAILHDIGAVEAQKKYGSIDGVYQEKEGPEVAKEILKKVGYNKNIDRICFIIGSHHTPSKIDGLDFQIQWEADLLENLTVMDKEKEQEKIKKCIDENFKTNAGKRIAYNRFILD